MDLSNVDVEQLSELAKVGLLAKFRAAGTGSMALNQFMLGGRTWIPRWRFQPWENLADALQSSNTAKASRGRL
jgi:hypothetical protein